MKFAIICPNDLSKVGGVQKISKEMHKRLKKSGHGSTLISFHPEKRVKIKGAKYFGKGIPLKFNLTSTEVTFENSKERERLKKYLKKENFDVICLHHPYMPLLCFEILSYSKSINIGWFHVTLTNFSRKYTLDIVEKPLSAWLTNKLHGFVAASQSVVETWEEVFEEKGGIVLGAGVDVNGFLKAARIDLGEDLNILFVGRLDKRKGVIDVIKTVDIIKNEMPVKLRIVGEGPQMDEATELVKKLDLSGDVEFLEKVEEKRLASYYKSSDVFVAPSKAGESLGVVLLEAMAAGTPVVAYANRGYKITLKNSPWKGSLNKVSSYKQLAKNIIKISKDSKLRSKVVNWQKKEVKKYDWENVIDKFLDYTKSVQKAYGK